MWNEPALALGLEAALLLGGMRVYLRDRSGPKAWMMIFGVVMMPIQARRLASRIGNRHPGNNQVTGRRHRAADAIVSRLS